MTDAVPLVVLDTNVLIAAIRSRSGASFRLLSLVGTGRFTPCVSVPLILEYEDVMKRFAAGFGMGDDDVTAIIDFLCAESEQRAIYFLWRPYLRDPKDDFVLELAVEAGAEFIVTHNVRDFAGSERFGVRVIRPGEFLRLIGDVP